MSTILLAGDRWNLRKAIRARDKQVCDATKIVWRRNAPTISQDAALVGETSASYNVKAGLLAPPSV